MSNFSINNVISNYTVERTISTLAANKIVNQWNGPQLNQVNITAIATSGSPSVSSPPYINGMSIILPQVGNSTIESVERFDIYNNSLYIQCTLPDCTGLLDSSFGICGDNYYGQVGPGNTIQFFADNEVGVGLQEFNPGDLYYQYYDGTNVHFTIVSQITNIATTTSLPYSNSTNERVYFGYYNVTELNPSLVITVDNIIVRAPNPTVIDTNFQDSFYIDTYVNTDGILENFPNYNVLMANSTTGVTINGISNYYLYPVGRKLTIVNVSGYIYTFNANSGTPNDTSLFLNGSGSQPTSTVTIYSNQSISFIYTVNNCWTQI